MPQDYGRELLPRTAGAIEDGMAQGLHTGVQVYVSRQGRPVADFGIGDARPGVPMTSATIVPWLSAGKPATAVAVARLWEEGALDLDDPVCRHLPEFARGGTEKESVTLRHLLTHTAGLKPIETGWPHASWEQVLDRVCDAPLVPGAIPGKWAAYDPTGGWFVLGEILARLRGRPFSRVVREEVFEPLGMHVSWNGMTAEEFLSVKERMGGLSRRDGDHRELLPWHDEPWCRAPSPGANLRSPARDLGRFYEVFLERGARDGRRVLAPETVARMTSRQRPGLYDETLQHVVDFGLGFIIDSNRHGSRTVPYGYGRYCSPETFGHGGAQATMAFADPAHGLAVAWAANGQPGEPKHQRRNRALNEAVYEDLGLAASDGKAGKP